MKRFCALVITAIFVLGLAVSPAFAGGGKVQGAQAVSDSFGGSDAGANDEALSPGNNAEGNQA